MVGTFLLLLIFKESFAGLYLGGYGGRVFAESSIKDRIATENTFVDRKIDVAKESKFGAIIGYKFAIIKAELELARYKADVKQSVFGSFTKIDNGTRASYFAFVNGYIFLPGIFKPYGGVGMGYVVQDISIATLPSKNSFGYQFILGASIGINIIDIFLDYRYLWLSKNGITNQDAASHSINLGLTLKIA